ncbi:tyrosine-type recombinase/integrase [Lysobacter sp. M2-1]|uniref:tyrosine-type recombinase/integrase n=1 Tax=Lysobacter sp. M2-1 TaxID=2916839 RepID=UPI001F5A66B9|nr:tyrosine-type recombinase/integrase [Lysobacter sp. M2-1]
MSKYLKQRKLGWYVLLPVPKELQQILGKDRTERTLRTRDKREAEKRKHAAIVSIQREWAEEVKAHNANGHPLQNTAEALMWHQEKGHATAQDTAAAFDASLEDHLDAMAKQHGRDREGHPRMPEGELQAIRRAVRTAAGKPDETLGPALDRHLDSYALAGDRAVNASTLDAKRTHCEEFIAWAGKDRSWRDVTHEEAEAYRDKLAVQKKGKGVGTLSPTSVALRLANVRGMFEWLRRKGPRTQWPPNPFEEVEPPKVTKRGAQRKRRGWTDDELSRFLRSVPSDDPQWSLVALLAYSGARREEVAALRVEDVEETSFLIRTGKRQASIRRVPVHPAVAPLMARLVETSSDGYVISGLTPGGKDKKRGHAIGKRFGHTLRALGITDTRVTLHTLRNTVVSRLKADNVPLPTLQRIVGHEETGSTEDYIGEEVPKDSAVDKDNRATLARITYGALDEYVKKTGAAVELDTKARRRKRPRAA